MAKEISSRDMPNQSADNKYYRSRQKSVIQRSPFEPPLRGIPTPPAVDPRASSQQRDLPRSSDVYYASAKKGRQPAPFTPPTAAPTAEADRPTPLQSPSVIVIEHSGQIDEKMKIALEWVKAGYAPVRVALEDRGLLVHARMRVEFAVTREEITEDQGRDIQFGLTSAAAAKGKKPPEAHKEVLDQVRAEEQNRTANAKSTATVAELPCPAPVVKAKVAPVSAKPTDDGDDGDGD